MKTTFNKIRIAFILIAAMLTFAPNVTFAQETKTQSLDQNISIFAEDEPLSDVIKKLCLYLNIDYSYNAKIIEDKKVSLSVSNKPLKYVLDKLMKDSYLLFELEDNILVVRDYIPLDKSIDYEQNTGQYFANNRGFLFNSPKRKSIRIKFKSASNLVIIPVTINKSDTLNFILSTSVQVPIITELPFVNELNLNYMKPVKINGFDGANELTAYRSGNNTLEIAGLTARNQEVRMIIDEDFQISHMLGIPVHGIIGFNLFKDYIVEIDYLSEKITLHKPEYYKYRDRKRDIIMPLYFDRFKPFIQTKIVTDELKDVRVKLLFDTGTSDALWLSETSDEQINLPQQHIETFLGKGLNGDLFGTKGRIDAIWVGPIFLPKPIVAYPKSEIINQLISSNDRNGTIGAEILRRFYVTVDYRNKRLTLRPNHKLKQKFNYNMSGMEVINPMPGTPIYTIANIRENSPAYIAGLKVNDQILWINNNTNRMLKLNDINLLLQSRENRKIKVKVLRNGKEFKTSFQLKKVF